MNEHYYTQVNETIKSIFDLTARVDERVQIMMKKQDELDVKIDSLITQNHDLNARVRVLESKNNNDVYQELEVIRLEMTKFNMRLIGVENTAQNQESKWRSIISMVLQFAGAVFTALVIYKLGIELP